MILNLYTSFNLVLGTLVYIFSLYSLSKSNLTDVQNIYLLVIIIILLFTLLFETILLRYFYTQYESTDDEVDARRKLSLYSLFYIIFLTAIVFDQSYIAFLVAFTVYFLIQILYFKNHNWKFLLLNFSYLVLIILYIVFLFTKILS